MKKHRPEAYQIEPFAVSRRRAFELVDYPKLVQRWLYCSRHATTPEERWVIIAREGGRGKETLIDYQSLKHAYQRFLSGEEPPPLPSEVRGKK